jgi:hypothetical protein
MIEHRNSEVAAHAEGGRAASDGPRVADDRRPGYGSCGELAGGVDGESDGGAAGSRGGMLAVSWPRLGHDLRTPLNAILGNTELLLDGSAGPLSSQARACLGDIQAAGRRMMGQVQVLLELCRLRTKPTIGSAVTLDLIELLRGAQAATLEDDAAMQVAPAGARLLVRGDPAWLGVVAAALIELYHGDGPAGGPLLVAVEPSAHHAAGAALLLSWVDFRPDQVAALPIALIDAILDLHEGKVALTADGLRLYWPASRLVHLEPAALLLASDGEGA